MIRAISKTGLVMEFPAATTWGIRTTGNALNPADSCIEIKQNGDVIAYVPIDWIVTNATPHLSDPVNGLTIEKAVMFLLQNITSQHYSNWGFGSRIAELKKRLQDFDSRTCTFKNQ